MVILQQRPSCLQQSSGTQTVFGAGSASRADITLQRAGSQGFSLKIRSMDVVDAEGADLEHGGEDKT